MALNPENLYGDRLFSSLERGTPAAGMLLLAAPGMASPEFARSVIFLVEHDEHGTLGVDLTQRSQTPVHNVLEPWAPLMSKPPVLYIGGPLNQNQPICVGVVRGGAELPEGTDDVTGAPFMERIAHRFALINLGIEPELVKGSLDGARIFARYAGWEPGQLDEEIDRGDWYVAPALPSDVLAPAAADIWGDCLRRQPWPLPLYGTYPVDVRDN